MRLPLVVVVLPLEPVVVLVSLLAVLPPVEPELVVPPLAPIDVLPLPVVPEPDAVLPLSVVAPALGVALGVVALLAPEPVVPVAEPALGVAELPVEAPDPVVAPEVPELDPLEVWAMDTPPMARAAAAARIVRVFLVVLIF